MKAKFAVAAALALAACGGASPEPRPPEDPGGNAENLPPVFEKVEAWSGTVLETVTFDIRAVDPEGTTVTYELLEAPPQGKLEGRRFTLPAGGEPGIYTARFAASDATGKEARLEVAIERIAVNQPPILAEPSPAEAELDVNEDIHYTFTATATDPEGDELELRWTLRDGAAETELSSTDLASILDVAKPAHLDELVVVLTAVDPGGASATHEWSLRYVQPAVYVAPGGEGLGTRWSPLAEVGAALAQAREDLIPAVRVAGGVYAEELALTEPVRLIGGYDPALWVRSEVQESVLELGRLGLSVENSDEGTEVRGFTIRSADATAPGTSAYGVRVIASKDVLLAENRIFVGRGADGAPGANGLAGAPGGDGQRGWDGSAGGTPGSGGATTCEVKGGNGGIGGVGNGAGGPGLPGSGPEAGEGSAGVGNPGGAGIAGLPGGFGVAAGTGVPQGSIEWLPTTGVPGTDGTAGSGASGGAAGDGYSSHSEMFLPAVTTTAMYLTGGGGGGGGAGGCGGRGGAPGQGGGGSFGILLVDSSAIRLLDNVVTVPGGAKGGAGGLGGVGGLGGLGGEAGLGEYACQMGCWAADDGFPGGEGGEGGDGGPGGAGAGGPSVGIAVFRGAGIERTGNELTIGAGGPGGITEGLGAAADGLSAELLQ